MPRRFERLVRLVTSAATFSARRPGLKTPSRTSARNHFKAANSRARASIRPMLTLEALAELLEHNRPAAAARVATFDIGGKFFDFNTRRAVMGVINLSADSWYRESVCLSADAAVQRARVLAAQGAEIVDVGAESSLANAARLDDAAQNSKLLPVIRGIDRKSTRLNSSH